MAKFDQFLADRQRILDRPYSSLDVAVYPYVADWMHEVKEAVGTTPSRILNAALVTSGYRRLAADHGLQIVVQDPENKIYELPLLVHDFDDSDGTVVARDLSLNQEGESWVAWMRDRGVSPEIAVHDGIVALGAVASVNEARLVIPEFGDERRLVMGKLPPLGGVQLIPRTN